jgi:hypothetical protein
LTNDIFVLSNNSDRPVYAVSGNCNSLLVSFFLGAPESRRPTKNIKINDFFPILIQINLMY